MTHVFRQPDNKSCLDSTTNSGLFSWGGGECTANDCLQTFHRSVCIVQIELPGVRSHWSIVTISNGLQLIFVSRRKHTDIFEFFLVPSLSKWLNLNRLVLKWKHKRAKDASLVKLHGVLLFHRSVGLLCTILTWPQLALILIVELGFAAANYYESRSSNRFRWILNVSSPDLWVEKHFSLLTCFFRM